MLCLTKKLLQQKDHLTSDERDEAANESGEDVPYMWNKSINHVLRQRNFRAPMLDSRMQSYKINSQINPV